MIEISESQLRSLRVSCLRDQKRETILKKSVDSRPWIEETGRICRQQRSFRQSQSLLKETDFLASRAQKAFAEVVQDIVEDHEFCFDFLITFHATILRFL